MDAYQSESRLKYIQKTSKLYVLQTIGKIL